MGAGSQEGERGQSHFQLAREDSASNKLGGNLWFEEWFKQNWENLWTWKIEYEKMPRYGIFEGENPQFL